LTHRSRKQAIRSPRRRGLALSERRIAAHQHSEAVVFDLVQPLPAAIGLAAPRGRPTKSPR
jgi:hypothetical protein